MINFTREQKEVARRLGKALYSHFQIIPFEERSVQSLKEFVAEFIALEYEISGINLPFPKISLDGTRVDLVWNDDQDRGLM